MGGIERARRSCLVAEVFDYLFEVLMIERGHGMDRYRGAMVVVEECLSA
jgi:hypothetical protein